MAKPTTDASEILIEQTRQGRTNERVEEARKPIADERGLSTEELMARFRTAMFTNVLPLPPELILKGIKYHLIWLSTNNDGDPIAQREAQGYSRVLPEELPGFQHMTVESGRFAGCIVHREMVLYKLPHEVWQGYMSIAHHERPYEQEEMVRDSHREMRERAREGGAEVYLGDGTSEFLNARLRRDPTFCE